MRDIDGGEKRTQESREDANRGAESNGAPELVDFAKAFGRICEAELPFSPQDESEDQYADAALAGGGLLMRSRRKDGRGRFDGCRVGAKKMRLGVKQHAGGKAEANKKNCDGERLGGDCSEEIGGPRQRWPIRGA